MAFEDLLSEVGNRGRFQILQMFSLVIPLIFMSSHFLLENFIAFVPNHRCRIPFLDNTSTFLSVSENLNFSSLLKLSIPLDSNGKLERCLRFSWPQWLPLSPNVTGQSQSLLETELCVDGWVYDQSIITSFIVTEWDLVCDSQSLRSLSQSIFLSGILVGYLTWGCLIDRFGRKRMLPPSFLMVAVSSSGPAFAQTFSVYCCLCFLIGFSISGAMFSSGAIVIEWTTIQHRPQTAVFIGLCISVGHLLLGVRAYGIQEWRKFQLIVFAPFFTFFLTIWWLPESARWLIVHKKYDDALRVLRKVAKLNGVKDLNLTVETLRSTAGEKLIASKAHYNMLDLFRFPVLKTRILCLSFEGFTTAMLFYGLSLDIQNLGSNIQMLQILMGASTLVSRFVSMFIMNCFGRRMIVVACLLLGGLSILASAFLPQGILRVVLTILGISCVVVCSSCRTVYSVELLPTVVRSMSYGFILTIDRIGVILAPLVNILKYYIPVLPQFILGIIAVTASLVIFFFLPETQNQTMPNTIQDIQRG
ncbi:LOW QUALITY PROTEIN: solute carrier family 22 member 11-like [Macrotis lagotis]|uniref:LOW QUALITY PROTEIN: solute carrier family 22 member 11-like n=1 Tax=Macrotis lagotis TaxID=92651 RepID=UPI003D6957DE